MAEVAVWLKLYAVLRLPFPEGKRLSCIHKHLLKVYGEAAVVANTVG
jgi:hypothetical protein